MGFESPQTPLQPAQPVPTAVRYLYPAASGGKRFLNFLIDLVAVQAILYVIVTGAFYLARYVPGVIRVFEGFQGILIFLLLRVCYYSIMEATTGRTLGKILTNTLVLDYRDGKPSVKQVIGRSFARLIPFEPFSFLGPGASGWHDTIPKTKVVDTSKPPNVIHQELTVRQALPPASPPPRESP